MSGINTLGTLAFNDAAIATIASGVLTFTQTMQIVAAESSTSDNLDTLTASSTLTLAGAGYNFRPMLLLKADTGDTITVTHAVGNIRTPTGSSATLSGDTIMLFALFGSTWNLIGVASGGGSGTVTSVGLSTDASYLTVGSSPVTSSGTITLNKTGALTANRVVATPDGAPGAADLRALVAADIPNLDASKITTGQLAPARGGTGQDFSASTGLVQFSAGTAAATTSPTISSFANATHDHEDAAGGGTLASAATPTAIHDDVAGEIAAVTEKVSPVSGDLILIEDSADSNNKKRVQIGNLPGGFTPQIVRVSDTKAQNTAQATYTAGAYRTMDLNTEDYDPSNIASVASNQVTLPAGKYHAVAVMQILTASVYRANLQFYNATAAAAISGSESINAINSANIRSYLALNVGFTLASSSAIEVQIYSDINTVAVGTLNRSGKSEVYLTVTFIRVSDT